MGVTTVSCTAPDNSDNTATEEFDVTVQDTTAPVISSVPADITVEAAGPGGATVNYSSPTATDLVDGSPPVDCIPASGFLFPIAVTTVSCSATDSSDNTATEQFDVTVQDTTAPVNSNVPADIITVASEPSGARPSYQLPTATDTVDGPVPVGCVPASGSLFPMGVTTVSCSATDTSDNTATGQFDVTVVPPLCRGRVATIWGSAGDDVLQGTPGTDVIVGFAGADLIDGRGGNDFICGGKGADEIRGGGGTDRIWGNAGHDTLRGGKGSDKLFGNGGNDALFGQAGRKDRLVGGGGVDSLDGGPGSADFCDGEIMVDCELGPS
jgi:Ca2+-binding RTX toxin-like protein